MIPIARDAGSIVAFGGRAMETDQQPKYLNSPETRSTQRAGPSTD
jgi:DNA primase